MFETWQSAALLGSSLLVVGEAFAIYLMRRHAEKREELFQIVTENAADMIALVDMKGRRLYNSPAYKRVLGYSPAELSETSAFEQIHVDDRFKVLEAARQARESGVGGQVEYRIRHKDGSWRVLESSASTVRNERGDVEKLVIVNRDITERRHAEQQLEHNSLHDRLTGLPNRQLFLDRLQQLFARSQRSPEKHYAVLLIDVDGFKSINDEIGHTAGDQLLVEISRRVQASLRHEDTVSRLEGKQFCGDAVLSRLGGDEFTILLDGISDPSDAMRVAKRIQGSAATTYNSAPRHLPIALSVGIALNTPAHVKAEDILQDAEVALRRAKAMGGSRCEVFDEAMHRRAVNRLRLEAELREAVDHGQFRAFYQPIVELDTRQAVGFEALLRWQHPQQGLIAPTRFLQAAENTGLLLSIGRWLLHEACRQLGQWQKENREHRRLRMTINVSARQFACEGLVDEVRSAVQEAEIEPGTLSLELNESTAMLDVKRTAHVLTQLRSFGVGLVLDDFATGYSSLRHLREFTFARAKIDQSLTGSMLTDKTSGDLVDLIVLLAQRLNLQIVAEGIETATQLEKLRNAGCGLGQGFLISPPLDPASASAYLASRQPSRAVAPAR